MKRAVGPGLAGFVLLYSLLAWVSYSRTSATFDEPGHLAAGYAALAKGDYRLDISHPPLARMLMAVPLLGMPDVKLDTTAIDQSWRRWMRRITGRSISVTGFCTGTTTPSACCTAPVS